MGRGEEGMEVLACVCVCVCVKVWVCVCICQIRSGGQVVELEMHEVYRWAKDRAAKKVSFQMLGTRTWVC